MPLKDDRVDGTLSGTGALAVVEEVVVGAEARLAELGLILPPAPNPMTLR
jgi:hypothetical protein